MRTPALTVAVVLTLTGCSGANTAEPPTAPAPTTASTAPSEGKSPARKNSASPADPYKAYLALTADIQKPSDWSGEWPLSRDDAQARALVGCRQKWAPGTIDAALQEAYADYCKTS